MKIKAGTMSMGAQIQMNLISNKLCIGFLCFALAMLPSEGATFSWGGDELLTLPKNKVVEIDERLFVKISKSTKSSGNKNAFIVERKMRLDAQFLLMDYCYSGNYKNEKKQKYEISGSLAGFQLVFRDTKDNDIVHIYSSSSSCN